MTMTIQMSTRNLQDTTPVATNNDLMYHVLCSEVQTQTGSNKHLFILTRTYSVQIFREIPFIKPQNDT